MNGKTDDKSKQQSWLDDEAQAEPGAAENPPSGSSGPIDPFDPSSLRLNQNFSQAVGVRKVLNTVPVRKPNRQDFIRVHPAETYQLETAVLELKEERETYLVLLSLWPELAGELTPKVLFTAINRQQTLFLWPIRLPGDDGRIDEWNASALEAAELAKSRWIRVVANLNLGAYEIYEATGNLPAPEWPEISFPEILRIAFKGRFIESLDHPAIRRLRGEL